MLTLYRDVSFKISRLVTRSYSTSFSIAVRFLKPELQRAIYSIYGFVRLADEIVDTFHDFDKESLLANFERDFYDALKHGISLNPVLNSFQETVRIYKIDDKLIQAFLTSMKTDLVKNDHCSKDETDDYIYGSAEAVGLMCLKVYTEGDQALFDELKQPAKKLGAAFQKVNFLRDLKNDMELLNRRYFHGIVEKDFDEEIKNEIINDIDNDFSFSFTGLKKLPQNSKLGVLIAYCYFRSLLKKIKRTPAQKLLEKRIRISGFQKFILFIRAYIACKLKLV
jgi:phytoene/squalene synthetase